MTNFPLSGVGGSGAYLLESIGLRTRIDFERLLILRAKLEGWLLGERIEGRLKQAGLAKTFISAV